MRLLNYVLLVTCGMFFCCKSVFAATSTCAPGYYGGYHWGPRCWGCPAGCFCIGGTQPAAFYGNSGWCERTGSTSYGWDMYAFSKDGTGTPEHISSGEEGAKIEQDNVKIIGLWQAGGLRRCPRDYPKSKPNSTSESDCYADVAGKQVYDISKKCAPGYYLPLQENECAWCKDDGRSYCPGGTFHTNLSSDSGISECKSGEKPNATKTACEKPKGVTCIAGTYMPADSSSCAACPEDKYCPGETYEDVQPIDRGALRCKDKGINMVPNYDHTDCEECESGTAPDENGAKCIPSDNIKVDPGYYLPKNSTEGRKCTAKRKYCPGGMFGKSSLDQGIYDCPYNGSANANFTGCKLELTKQQLKMGLSGKIGDTASQCWIKTDPSDYKACVYGTRTQEIEKVSEEEKAD